LSNSKNFKKQTKETKKAKQKQKIISINFKLFSFFFESICLCQNDTKYWEKNQISSADDTDKKKQKKTSNTTKKLILSPQATSFPDFICSFLALLKKERQCFFVFFLVSDHFFLFFPIFLQFR